MTSQAFATDLGVRVPAITTDQMREVDRVAIEELGPNLYQMMENAGRNLAVTVLETIGAAWSETPIAVLSGTGGNGGGGICAARHLANRGADVTVVVTDPAGLTPVPSEQLASIAPPRARWRNRRPSTRCGLGSSSTRSLDTACAGRRAGSRDG